MKRIRYGRSLFASSRGLIGTPIRVRTESGNRCSPRCAGPVSPGDSVEAFTGTHQRAEITSSHPLRSGELTASGLGGALAVCAVLLAACGASDEESRAKHGGGAKPVSQVLKLSVETAPGVVTFDKERLSAKAGRIAFELTNDKRKGHNIRIHTGDTCCFRPGSKDIGGTRTIGTGRTRVVLDLKPGTYTYLCSTGGYWRTQHGTLVVR